MKNVSLLLAAVGLGAAMVVPAMAQPPAALGARPGFGQGVGPGFAARGGAQRLARIAQALGLTDAQKTDIRSTLKDAAEKRRAIAADTKLTPAQRRERLLKLRAVTRERVEKVLTPDQRTRLARMLKRGAAGRFGGLGAGPMGRTGRMGPIGPMSPMARGRMGMRGGTMRPGLPGARPGVQRAMRMARIARALDLTDDQKARIKEIVKDNAERIRQIRADERKRIMDVLTPDQRRKAEQMERQRGGVGRSAR